MVIIRSGVEVELWDPRDLPLTREATPLKKNLYIQDEKQFLSLGKEVYENGSYWMLIMREGKITEGVHRVQGLKDLYESNPELPVKLVPVLNLKKTKELNKKKFKLISFENIRFWFYPEEFKRHGLKIKFVTETGLIGCFKHLCRVPFVMGANILWDYKMKYGPYQPPLKPFQYNF